MSTGITRPDLAKINRSLYELETATADLEALESCGEDCDELRLRFDDMKKKLKNLQQQYGKPT